MQAQRMWGRWCDISFTHIAFASCSQLDMFGRGMFLEMSDGVCFTECYHSSMLTWCVCVCVTVTVPIRTVTQSMSVNVIPTESDIFEWSASHQSWRMKLKTQYTNIPVCLCILCECVCLSACVFYLRESMLTFLCWIWVNGGQPAASDAGSTSVACHLHRLWPVLPEGQNRKKEYQ